MAGETTSTTWGNTQGLQLAQVLGQTPLPANLPKIVLLNLVNQDSIAGQPSKTKRYPVFSDLGAASGATEGTDLSSNTELAMANGVDIAVAENAAVLSTVTDVAAERLFPGRTGVPELFQAQDPQLMLDLLGPQAQRHMAMCLEKVESDLKDLLSGLSNTAGGGATVDLTIDDLFDADYTYQTLDPVSDRAAYFLWPHQVTEVRKDMSTAGGGFGGAVWGNADVSAFMSLMPDMPTAGLQGSFLGRPVFQGTHSLREESGNAAYGALMTLGNGQAPDAIGASVSPFCYVEGRAGFTHYVDLVGAGRRVNFTTVLVYGVGEIKDNAAVAIVSDDA